MKGFIVRELRKQLRLSQVELGELVGRTEGRISQIERSEDVEVMGDIFPRFVEALKTKSHILLGQPPPDDTREEVIHVPILGFVPCGTPFPSDESREGYYEVCASHVGNAKPDNLFAVRASGNSLIGDGIEDGDYLIVEKQAPLVNGKIYILRLGNEVVARHCYLDGNSMKLIASNGEYQDIKVKQVENLGRVILSGKWDKH